MIDLDITKRLGDFTLNAAFHAPAGITALFGASGSGKTSVVNAVAGINAPDQGRIVISDRVLFDSTRKIDVPVQQRSIGYVFQDARLFPHMTVARNLAFGGTHHQAQVVDLLGLGPLLKRYPRHLSGGEQQRVALGRALMSDPAVLLMDEPLAALDAPRKAEIMPYLIRLRDTSKMPILYVSHDISEVARLATTIVVMRDGIVACAGRAEDILSDPNMVPLIGVRDAGSVIVAQISRFDREEGLTTLAFSGGEIVLPGTLGTIGQNVRLRIPAQDVILSRTKPEAISAINVLPVTINQLLVGTGPGVAVSLQSGDARFLARITQQSAQRLNLAAGNEIFAILKATALAASDTDIGG